ncbi:MAG: pentapeptide repeat-containing protein [Myxococcota bacterium]
MSPSQPPRDDRLRKGFSAGGAVIAEPLTRGERISSFRGHRNDGASVTLHAITETARPREVQNFLDGARQLAAAARVRPLQGVVEVVAVVPSERLYIGLGGVTGTMSDIPILGWGVEDTLAFFRHLCRALRRVHKTGLVHGCLQPGNVLLDDDLEPRLADVGCLVLDDSYDGPSDMKHDYSAYAAREVRLGERAGPRSDVYSLGRLLQFALMGSAPSHDDSHVLRLDGMSDLPAGLVRITRKATLRDPSRRYATVDSLLVDLERWRDADTVGVAHPEGREGSPDDSGRYGALDLDDGPFDRGRPSERPPVPGGRFPSTAPTAAASSAGGETGGGASAAAPAAPAPVMPAAAGSAPVDEAVDPLSPLQVRLLGGTGVVAGIGALAVGYNTGVPTLALTLLFVGGVVGASLFIPPVGHPGVSRFTSALILGLLAWFVDPVPRVALAGRRALVERGAPQVRGQNLVTLRDRGWRDFSQLDLSGADLSRLQLTGLRFDAATLRGAKCVGANLSASSFDGTDVSGADFSGADLSGADTSRMRGWLTAHCDDDTVMPRGWGCDPETESPRAAADLAATPNEL